jgi:hypothetical protein
MSEHPVHPISFIPCACVIHTDMHAYMSFMHAYMSFLVPLMVEFKWHSHTRGHVHNGLHVCENIVPNPTL